LLRTVHSAGVEWNRRASRVVSPRQTQQEGREVVQFKRAVPCGVERGRRPLLFAFEEHGAKEPERRGGLQVRSRRTACTPHHSTARRLRFVASAEYSPLWRARWIWRTGGYLAAAGRAHGTIRERAVLEALHLHNCNGSKVKGAEGLFD
jgi:hypothetical protein